MVERLTYEKSRSGWDRGKYPTKYTSRHTFQEVVARLAAYEDTGLEPEGIKALIPPPNAPLTLERLREMDGEPVYDWMGYEWFVVSEVADDGVIMTDGTVFDIDEDSVNSAVGRFYRRKPGEGTP